MDILDLSLIELSDKLKTKKISSLEATNACLARIEKTKHINALNFIARDTAIKQAKDADKKIADGNYDNPLLGVPIVVKDNICVADMPCTCGSNMLKNFIPAYNAGVADKLNAAGAVILGKANMDEFAMGSSNETSAFGKVLNPVDNTCVPGGSSGGSAASVAAKQCFASIGSDTGGSIRQPAGLCGIVGVKPTYGLVSRFGVIPFGSSLDQVGTLARSVPDAALLLNAISGHDQNDSTSYDIKYPDLASINTLSLKNLKIGIIKEFAALKIDSEVEAAYKNALSVFEKQGAKLVEVSMPYADVAISLYIIISNSEASSNLAKYDGIKYGYRASAKGIDELYELSRSQGFGDEVKRRILFGNYVLMRENYEKYFVKACKIRTLIVRCMKDIFTKCDVVLTPTSPTPAFKFGTKLNPVEKRMADIFLTFTNMVGVPCMSMPCANTAGGLPIGLHLIGDVLQDKKMLQIAHTYEVTK